MLKTHIVTPGFTSAGGTALLTPIHRFAGALERRGIQWRVFSKATAALPRCNVLIVDSDVYRGLEPEEVAVTLQGLREKVQRLIWVDSGVSTGLLQTWALPYVHSYWKGQVLRDRNLYLRPMYGGRYFTDYYHRYLGIDDEGGEMWPAVDDVLHLRKIRVSWNAAFVDHSVTPAWAGPSKGNGGTPSVRAPRPLARPSVDRPVDVVARFGARDYPQATLSFQRHRLRTLLGGKAPMETLSRDEYLEEIRQAKVVLAPFGLGEITPRDFEAFLAGAVLVKPVMNIVETWPALYTEGMTFWAHNWRVEYADFLVENMLEQYHKVVDVARVAQERYFRHVAGRWAAERFADRFVALVSE